MKMFSNSGICVCYNEAHMWSMRTPLDVFRAKEEYPYDYFFGSDGKEIRVFEIDEVGNPSTAHILSGEEFAKGFMTKAQWNARARHDRDKT